MNISQAAFLNLLLAMATLTVCTNTNALPAFARRENVSCTMCHAAGSAPHLTEFGYMYRRMAFHWPDHLGDEKNDDIAMDATKHMAAGVNVAYSYADTTNSSGKRTLSANGINVPEVELWPLVGGFMGNWGVWSEFDATPSTNTGGGVKMDLADLRYASGTPDMFYNFRVGNITPEGFGASDQWLSDANLPLIDKLSANFNQDTLVTPWGAMNSPELGAEVGLNYERSHVTLGIYNGYTVTTLNPDGSLNTNTPTIIAASNKPHGPGMRDYRLQYDQFLGTMGAVTLGYYTGTAAQVDPTGATFGWDDHFSQERIYLTGFAIPGYLDILAGAGWSKNEYVSTSATADGTFESKGSFLGFNCYVRPHLTVSGRTDKFYYNSTDSATGYSLQVSMPFDNRILVFHFNSVVSTIPSTIGGLSVGSNTDAGIVLRFLM